MKTDNELIAEFVDPDWNEGFYQWRPGCIEPIEVRHLQYHSSWSWLMPVIEKIESEYISVTITSKHASMYKNRDDGKGSECICYGMGQTKIEAVYNSVVNFIKWYNSKK